jgi:hypothetical protein
MQYTLALSIGGSYICTVGRATGTGMKAALFRSSQQQCRTVRHGFVFVCVCTRDHEAKDIKTVITVFS